MLGIEPVAKEVARLAHQLEGLERPGVVEPIVVDAVDVELVDHLRQVGQEDLDVTGVVVLRAHVHDDAHSARVGVGDQLPEGLGLGDIVWTRDVETGSNRVPRGNLARAAVHGLSVGVEAVLLRGIEVVLGLRVAAHPHQSDVDVGPGALEVVAEVALGVKHRVGADGVHALCAVLPLVELLGRKGLGDEARPGRELVVDLPCGLIEPRHNVPELQAALLEVAVVVVGHAQHRIEVAGHATHRQRRPER